MDKLLQNFLLSFTIAIPAITGLVRYKIIEKQYRPFTWICWIITLNELLMFVLIRMKIFTFISYNLAIPVICFLYLLQFREWGLFARKKYLFQIIFGTLFLVWIADHFLVNGYRLASRTVYFRVCYSLALVLLSVNSINRQIVSEKKSLLQNSRFLICMGLVVYYTYRIIVDAFSIKGMSQGFLMQLGDFSRVLLVGLNLLFAVAVLWIPTKKNYTIQF